jgi:transposase-like protein
VEATMACQRRRYSDEERAQALAALAANGGNISLTAKQLDIPIKTLSNWANGIRHPESAQMGNEKKKLMADVLEEIAWKLIDAIPGKVKKAPLGQTVTSMAIAVDKMRLLRNLPTELPGAAQALDLSKLTDEELEEYDRLLAKAAIGGEGETSE